MGLTFKSVVHVRMGVLFACHILIENGMDIILNQSENVRGFLFVGFMSSTNEFRASMV